jgi:hypothetical protein
MCRSDIRDFVPGEAVSGAHGFECLGTRVPFLHLARACPSRVSAKSFNDSQSILQGRIADALAALHAVVQLHHVARRRLQMQFNDESGLFLAGHCTAI